MLSFEPLGMLWEIVKSNWCKTSIFLINWIDKLNFDRKFRKISQNSKRNLIILNLPQRPQWGPRKKWEFRFISKLQKSINGLTKVCFEKELLKRSIAQWGFHRGLGKLPKYLLNSFILVLKNKEDKKYICYILLTLISYHYNPQYYLKF